tara:strand:+ start:935 stop:1111 length:177 start_codon:yes stop_codon:yes gene_type:complete
MSKNLDMKIYLALDKIERQIRRAAYLATAETFQKKIYDALELIVEAKEEVEKRLDNSP